MGENVGTEVLERLIRIETKIESWDKSKEQIYENQRKIISLMEQTAQQGKEIADMQGKFTWMNRTAWAAIITAVSSIIVMLIK
ncbi:MAG: hypothetical protein NC307_13185 [Roseburia sp.]|nr:hypothetical protein [Roseburia sp.]